MTYTKQDLENAIRIIRESDMKDYTLPEIFH